MIALLASSLGLGLRHGVDWDHISAITDITGTEYDRRRSAFLAILYALGHGAAVLALGALAIVAGERLPNWIDPLMERVVGATLLVLAVLLVRSLWRNDGARTSRGVMLMNGLRALRRRLQRTTHVEIEHAHPHHHGDATVVTAHVHAVDVTNYTVGGALLIGLLHGVGAETGTQALVLVSASRVSSAAGGLAVLVAFVAGIIITTGAIALSTAFGWNVMSGRGRAYRILTVATAAASGLVGIMFVTGHAGALPGLA